MKTTTNKRENPNQCKLSIGLPVYNGEQFIGDAVDSLLQQSYRDFELIICDNASTDNTEEICRKLVGKDDRIHYHRNSENIGAAANFNKVFELASCEYFKWAAHDDILASDFLEKCVAVLDANSDCVLAYSQAFIVGENGEPIEAYDTGVDASSRSASVRFTNLLGSHKCFEIFGVIRRDVLERTPLMGAYAHGDGVLLARLGLFGRFLEIPEYLFFPRRHGSQSMAILSRAMSSQEYSAYAAWFDPKFANTIVFPYWTMAWEFFCSVHIAPLAWGDRLRCYYGVGKRVWCMKRKLLGDLRFAFRQIIRGIGQMKLVPGFTYPGVKGTGKDVSKDT